LIEEMLRSVAIQLMEKPQVELEGKSYKVSRSTSRGLRMAKVVINGREVQAIEQNRQKLSRWGKLAKSGSKVVQFRDVITGKYLAVSVDGEVMMYGKDQDR